MKVPTYQRTEFKTGANVSNINRAGVVGEAISKTGFDVMDMGLKIVERNMLEQAEQERARQTTDAETAGILAMKDVEEKVMANRDEHMSWGDQFEEQATKRMGEVSNNITDKNVKESFNNWTKQSIVRQRIKLSEEGKKVSRDVNIAALTENALVIKDQAIRDKDNYLTYEKIMSDSLDVQIGLGNINSVDAVKYLDAWRSETIDGHIENDIEQNPYQALKDLKSDEYPDLHERRKTYWMKHAEAGIGKLEAAEKARREKINYLTIAETALSSGKPLDHGSDEGKKAAEALYESRFGDVDLDNIKDAKNRSLIVETFGRLGVIPKSVQSYIRSRSMAGSTEQRIAMADLVDRLEERNPVALTDMSDSDLAYAKNLSNLVRAGIEPKTALQTAQRVAYEMPEGEKKLLDKRYTDDKLEQWNSSRLEKMDFVEGDVPNRMRAQYEKGVRSLYYSTGGDIELARNIMSRRIGKQWSYSPSSKRMMEYAPENILGDIDPDTRWIGDQFNKVGSNIIGKIPKETLTEYEKTIGKTLTPDELSYEADPTFRRNPTVGYQVMLPGDMPLLTEDGSSVRWLPDYEKTGRIEKRMEQAKEVAEMNLEKKERALLLRQINVAKTPEAEFKARAELEKTKAYQRIKATDKKRYK